MMREQCWLAATTSTGHGVTIRGIVAFTDHDLDIRPSARSAYAARADLSHLRPGEVLAEAARDGRFTMEAANGRTLRIPRTHRPSRRSPPSRKRSRTRSCHDAAETIFRSMSDEDVARRQSSMGTYPAWQYFRSPTTSTGIIAVSCMCICGCSGRSRPTYTTIEPRNLKIALYRGDRMRVLPSEARDSAARGSAASAQGWQPPSESQRCPSKWGKGDQRGSGNHMKPETVLKAARLIKTGEVFELGRVLQEGMPMPAGRRFEIMTKRTRNDPGTNAAARTRS